MESSSAPTPKRAGRPLSFDRDKALQQAMLQFWKTGYETTGVAELTAAMGISTPSLYTAFGDKESLFLECLARYTNPGPKPVPELIREAPSARVAAQQLLEFSARWYTQPDAPAGCMVASAAATGSDSSRKVRAALGKVRQENQKALQRRAEKDRREGHLPATANPKALAAMTMAIVSGMSTLARDGADRATLLQLVETAMRAWPVY